MQRTKLRVSSETSSPIRISLSLKMESIGCPETSETNYHSAGPKMPEERGSRISKFLSLYLFKAFT